MLIVLLILGSVFIILVKNIDFFQYNLGVAIKPFPCLIHLYPMNIQYNGSLITTTNTCYIISFILVKNEDLFVHLYIPNGSKSDNFPIMLVLYHTGSLGKRIIDGNGKQNHVIVKELAESENSLIAPDYLKFGYLKNYVYNDHFDSETTKGIFNYIRCIDILLTLNQLKSDRIGVIGDSFRVNNALFMVACVARLKKVNTSRKLIQVEHYEIGPKTNWRKIRPFATKPKVYPNSERSFNRIKTIPPSISMKKMHQSHLVIIH